VKAARLWRVGLAWTGSERGRSLARRDGQALACPQWPVVAPLASGPGPSEVGKASRPAAEGPLGLEQRSHGVEGPPYCVEHGESRAGDGILELIFVIKVTVVPSGVDLFGQLSKWFPD
jgi:hypothetical protein